MGVVEDAFRARHTNVNRKPIIAALLTQAREQISLTAEKLRENGYPAYAQENWAARSGEYKGHRCIIWVGAFSQLKEGDQPPYTFESVAALKRAFGFYIDESGGRHEGKLLLTHDVEPEQPDEEVRYPHFDDADLEDRDIFDPGTLGALLGFLKCLQEPEKPQVYHLPDVPRPDWL